jgi:hypothetical protein
VSKPFYDPVRRKTGFRAADWAYWEPLKREFFQWRLE